MKQLLLLGFSAVCTLLLSSFSQAETMSSIGADFHSHSDVGAVQHAGAVAYDASTQTYEISGSGSNMWFGADECHFVWRKLSGDFILTANARFVGEGVDPHRKIGWMIRADLEGDSPYADVALHGDGLTSLQFRRQRGADTEQLESAVTMPEVLQLERQGGKLRMAVAKAGETFSTRDLADLQLPDEVYVGLFVCAHNAEVVERAEFHNVRITLPAAPDFRPYQDYIGGRLETMEVANGNRHVNRTFPGAIQAPNWTVDGRALVYNLDGKIYRFDLETNESTLINTGPADRNNNDHALSHDGMMLGISHHSSKHHGDSIIYTLPLAGGEPKLITPRGPSYLHGWSPDGQWLTYTGGRYGQYDIYKIRSDGSGQEVQLTKDKPLADGSEFSPEGRFIYYNSARSGSMQIWRMNPDGSEPQQLTNDGLNNWFPHPSPDGRQLVFLSYGPEIAPEDHPWYKHVYLRSMPVEGGEPRVIAYLYGGQGTINVNSWSPDSGKIAFVSNTQVISNTSPE